MLNVHENILALSVGWLRSFNFLNNWLCRFQIISSVEDFGKLIFDVFHCKWFFMKSIGMILMNGVHLVKDLRRV